MTKKNKLIRLVIFTLALLNLGLLQIVAGDVVLSNNKDGGNAVWFVDGEASLVMNGFDLGANGLVAPITIDAVNLSVAAPVPGQSVEIVIYEDANGGSPADAVLVARFPVAIETSGMVRIQLPEPKTINAPAIWVGAYMPTGFKFHADTSGSSVLTYWAWQPGGVLDLNNLGGAGVLGPANGTAPVNIDMKGIARITAEVSAQVVSDGQSSIPLGQQIVADTVPDLSVLKNYEYCGPVLYDSADLEDTGQGLFTLDCRAEDVPPPAVEHTLPNRNFERRGYLYELTPYGGHTQNEKYNDWLKVPVTHCIKPQPGDLEQAVIGVAYGVPRIWHIQPTVRYGELVCTEITNTGLLSYFVPFTNTVNTSSGNLVWSRVPDITPHPLECGQAPTWTITFLNAGNQAVSQAGRIVVQDVLVRTNEVIKATEYYLIPQEIKPGQTVSFTAPGFKVDAFVGELHRLVFILDQANEVAESNEYDNSISTEYILQKGGC